MTALAPFALKGYNPDVLTCIANLSNDEVFTPPEFANRMLDTLEVAWAEASGGASIWTDPTVTFLDPFTKSGVFLREIVARLTVGLEKWMPDLERRVDHILTKQVFGIGITQLTALLARRSVYCSKLANGPHSIATSFTTEDGNIWFERTEHTWAGDKCAYCPANRQTYERDEALETHAYAFIHTTNAQVLLDRLFGDGMRFDVVVGNPPYQLGDGAAGASPIYQQFVRAAKSLEPRYISMVTPSRWFAGGNRLDDYRAEMLADKRMRVLVDFPVSAEVFPGVDVGGGISYFLWDAVHSGECEVTTVRGDNSKTVVRDLDAYDIFVRDSEAVSILEKVLSKGEQPLSRIVSKHAPFGLKTNFSNFRNESRPGDIALHYNGGGRMAARMIGYIDRSQVGRGAELVDKWKILVSEAYRIAERFPNRIVGAPMLSGPGEACTQTFLVIGGFESEDEAASAASYYSTKFFRFLLWLRKIGQHASQSVYAWVPMQRWDREWTDAALYEKYGLADDEIAYIESLIKPMGLDSAED